MSLTLFRSWHTPAMWVLVTVVFIYSVSRPYFVYSYHPNDSFIQRTLIFVVRELYWKPRSELSVAACACNSSTREVETGESGVQGLPQLHREFEASLALHSKYQGYTVRHYLR